MFWDGETLPGTRRSMSDMYGWEWTVCLTNSEEVFHFELNRTDGEPSFPGTVEETVRNETEFVENDQSTPNFEQKEITTEAIWKLQSRYAPNLFLLFFFSLS